jgi:phosphoribosyl 1,2-cyclic phosphodiesterase
MITYKGKRVMIDCGEDWLKKVWQLKPDAIVITHAHPDHAFGLKDGSPCPVYATKESWQIMQKFAIPQELRYLMQPLKRVTICGITFEAFPVVHSIRAPGVGYRITAGNSTIFCVHDLVYIEERAEALKNINLYIGDGATITRPMVRKKGNQLFGHTPISTQLTWCKKEKVPRMIVTHCGTQIVGADGRTVSAKIRALAKTRGVQVQVAYDGLEVEI